MNVLEALLELRDNLYFDMRAKIAESKKGHPPGLKETYRAKAHALGVAVTALDLAAEEELEL